MYHAAVADVLSTTSTAFRRQGEVMTDDTSVPTGITRRSLLGGIGAAAGAASLSGRAVAGAPIRLPDAMPQGVFLNFPPAIPGLVYLGLDAVSFHTAGYTSTPFRQYQFNFGMRPSAPGDLYAPLPIQNGSTVKDLRIVYIGTPTVYIAERSLNSASFDVAMPPVTLPERGIASYVGAVNVELKAASAYVMVVECRVDATIIGMELGYIPPAQAFIPFSGLDPRVLDTRSGAKFAPGEVRVIDLSSRLIPTARAAVINLTATATSGAGFLSAFADGIAFPGNSTVNYNAANESVANGAVVTMANGKIKVRCGDAASHVIVDVIGSLL
jgi:hypothetical protein